MVLKKTFLFVVLISITVLSACSKSKWKETSPTNVYLKMNTTQMEVGANTLFIDTLSIHFDRLDLNGKRLQAEDVSLSSDLSGNFSAIGNQNALVTTFAVPQGTYEPLQLGADIGEIAVPIVLKGRYVSANGTTKIVRIELNYDNYLLYKIVKNNAETISIDKEENNEILINFDMQILFDEMNPSHWNAATPSSIGGQNGVAISASQNSNLYNLIAPKVNETISFEM